MKNLKVKDVMSSQVQTINENENLLEVQNIFRLNRFHHLPVVNNEDELVGIISQTDFERLKSGASLFGNPGKEKYNDSLFQSILVEQVMTRDVHFATPEDDMYTTYQRLDRYRFRALPVVDNGNLVGIITPMDMLHYVFKKQ